MHICISTGITETRTNTLKALRIILYVLSVIGIIIEVVQLVTKRHQYFLNLHSYAEVTVYVIVLFFIQVDESDCWCNGELMWQLGAVGCVFAWLNLVYILKRLPFTAIPINMMLNILATFFSVILLPILLIATFAVPFYMLLSRPVSDCVCNNAIYTLSSKCLMAFCCNLFSKIR